MISLTFSRTKKGFVMVGHKESFNPRPGGKFVYVGRGGEHYQAECLGFGSVDGKLYPIMLVKTDTSRGTDDIGFVKNDGQPLVYVRTFAGRFYDALEEKIWSAMVYIDIVTGQPETIGVFSGINNFHEDGPYEGQLEFVTAGNEIKSVNYTPKTKKG